MRSIFSVIQRSFYTINLFQKVYEAQFSLFIELFTLRPEKKEIQFELKITTYNTKFNLNPYNGIWNEICTHIQAMST
jgi:hypothetical protein